LPDTIAALARLELLQVDALRELSHIGSAHAATALSRMTGRRVGVTVPAVTVGRRDLIAGSLADREPSALVRLTADGGFSAAMVVAFSERHAHDLVLLLLGRDAAAPWNDALAESALLETGNVLAGAYVGVLAQILGCPITLSPPTLATPGANLGREVQGGACDYVLCLETALTIADTARAARGWVLILPEQGTVAGVLAAVGLPVAS
jgi:chemotaxis protein CheC